MYIINQKNGKFEIIIDEIRNNLLERLMAVEKGKLTFLYGSPGQDKSISLIILWLKKMI